MSRFNRGTVGRVDAILDGLDADELARYAVEHRRRAVEAVFKGAALDEGEARRIGRRASASDFDRARFCELSDEAEKTTLAAISAAELAVGLIRLRDGRRFGRTWVEDRRTACRGRHQVIRTSP
jgi:hypothetical protein